MGVVEKADDNQGRQAYRNQQSAENQRRFEEETLEAIQRPSLSGHNAPSNWELTLIATGQRCVPSPVHVTGGHSEFQPTKSKKV